MKIKKIFRPSSEDSAAGSKDSGGSKNRRLFRPSSEDSAVNKKPDELPKALPSTPPSDSDTPTAAIANDSYVPPAVWKHEKVVDESPSASRPTAGARHEQVLPRGKHRMQLYSMATPNGQKVTIMLEELLEAGYSAEYDAWMINIIKGDQFGSEFTNLANPNSKIPALLDYGSANLFEMLCASEAGPNPIRVFESCSILLHLSEKFGNAFVPALYRTEIRSWLFWQVGSAPFLGGGFGHFFAFAQEKLQYPINRFTMEVKRQLDVLEHQLTHQNYIVGDQFTLADIAIFPWYGGLVLGDLPYKDATTFLSVEKDYPKVMQWAKRISERPAVKRGLIVNKTWGDKGQLVERHSPQDIIAALSG